MSDKHATDRPREKLLRYGAAKLSDHELLMAMIGSGNATADVQTIARRVLKVLQQKGKDISKDDLLAIGGIGQAKAVLLASAFELAYRYKDRDSQIIIDTPAKAAALLSDIRSKQQEHFVVVTLDGANRLINRHIVTTGTLTASLVHPRGVFSRAIADNAASIIVAHNHPSGSLEPSVADSDVTGSLAAAGEILGIKLVDHLIVSKDSHRSI